MAQEFYQKVAYIGLNNPDGSLMLNVPLYVKVSEVNKNGMTDMQETIMHRISEIMILTLLIVFLLLILIAPLLPHIISFVVWLIKWIFKILWAIISFPFKLIGKLRNRRGRGDG